MQNIETQNIDMNDITRHELANIDGGSFWSAVGCGLLAAIVDAGNPAAAGVAFVECYF